MSCPSNVPAAYDNSSPNVVVYSGDNCQGQYRSLPPGSHTRPFAISSIVVPPNTVVQGSYVIPAIVCTGRTPQSQWSQCGKGKTVVKTFTPGVYNLGSQGIKDDTGAYAMNGAIINLNITKPKSHADFLRDCCLGIEPELGCANYAGYTANACKSTMSSYCGASLARFREPTCKQWCASNSGECDSIAGRLCAPSPTDSFCACFHTDPTIIRPSCFDPKCSSGIAYQTEEQKNSATNCGVYCNQQFNIDKVTRDALINDNTFNQQCSSTVQAYKNELAAAKAPPPVAANAPSPVGKTCQQRT